MYCNQRCAAIASSAARTSLLSLRPHICNPRPGSARDRLPMQISAAAAAHGSASVHLAGNGAPATYYPHGMKQLPGPSIEEVIKRLGPKFEEVPLEKDSAFVKPRSLFYQLDGKMRRWDAIESHGSVGVVLYHTQWRAFIIVRQFRPAVYACARRAAQQSGSPEPHWSQGFTFELCAGILDKAKSPEETVKEEIEEETGYVVDAKDVRFINSHISSSGTAGARHYMFYAEVDESKRSSSGGGLVDHGELIEVLSVPLNNTGAFLMDPSLNSSPGLMYGLLWARDEINAGRLGGASDGNANPLATGDLQLKSVLPS